MPEQGHHIVAAAPGWHVAVVHERDPGSVELYAVAAWLVTDDADGDPELIPFIAHCRHGPPNVGLFSAEGELAARVLPPDGILDEEDLRDEARLARERRRN